MARFATLADGFARGNDNFLLLRLLAAALVVYGHAAAIGGRGTEDVFAAMGWGRYSGGIAVDLFFIISGFLVTASWLRRADLAGFLRARALRIVPAYAACVLGCTFVLGPILTTLSLPEYFSDAQTWSYAWTNLHFGPRLSWLLPGVFAGHPIGVVNGSIWTLPIEVLMYACVAATGIVGLLARRTPLTAVLAALSIPVFVYFYPAAAAPFTDYLRMAGLFALGSLCFVWRERIPNHGIVVVAFAVSAWIMRGTPVYAYLFAPTEAAFVFWFVYRLGGTQSRLHAFNRFGDYSYGLYLWGYPAQQIAVAIAGPQSALANTVCGLASALPVAIVSWHLIEQPALKLKTRTREPAGGKDLSPDPSRQLATTEKESA